MDISLLFLLMAALSQADAHCGSYNSATHICCKSTLHPRNGVQSLRCCGHDVFNKLYNGGLMCCNNVTSSIAGMRQPRCCGTAVYDKNMAKCLSGSVYVKLGGDQPKCCGNTIFDASFFQCCSDGQARFNCDSSPIPITATCPSGFEKLEENCYAFQNERGNYQEARDACIAMGAFLIEPRSEVENNFMKHMVNANNGHNIWLGANDLNNEGQYVWETSGGLVSGGYTDWNPIQPDNWKDREHCMELSVEYGQWNDQMCHKLKHFICQTPLDIPSTTTQPSTTTIGQHPPMTATCEMRRNPNFPPGPGDVVGTVKFFQSFQTPYYSDLSVNVSLSGFDIQSSLLKGFHVHQKGDLSGGCESTGGHYNPLQVNHGARHGANSERHFGDLGSIHVDPVSGRVDEVFHVLGDGTSLYEPHSIIGRAIVIHNGEDDLGNGGDEGSRKTGNAGPRIACCVIGRGD